ncbi:dolichyl-diphosphooligosaccharide--protein glycotransferase subunit OST1 [Sporobolomyces salmoneus]|uniref:dolichyl-diphosphooligosaccharide--protein glycotransferase subunit OST1 n=1 Tax=Sporobolomyces salmoneus TaxID=183962 RepID=UPI00317D366C
MRPWTSLVLPLLAVIAPISASRQEHFAVSTSAYSPTQVSTSIELGGSLTRSSTTYQLVKAGEAGRGGDEWVVGIKHGGKTGGWLEATQGKGGKRSKVDLVPIGSNDDIHYYSLTLPPSTKDDAKATVTISTVLSHASKPKPEVLPQNAESIYLMWEGDLLAPLAGLSTEQKSRIEEFKVRVKTPTPRVLSAKEPEGFAVAHAQGSAMVTFTPKGSVANLGPQIAAIHYQQPEAVASIRDLNRIVELSHWGSNLAIQDNIELSNSGPALDGNFARIDHQKATMMRRQNNLAITSLSISLPPHAHAAYYYDSVGNVSTSRFRPSTSPSASGFLPSQQKKKNSASVASPALLELTPRYPLLGGWNFSFTIGYDLPLQEWLKVRKGGEGPKYVAAVPFLTPIKDVAVDKVRLEIRLPEGARNVRAISPYPVEQHPLTTVKTYLDSIGRPTVVMEKTGCTDRHGENVLIEYDLPLLVDLLQKPLACASVLSSIFLIIIVMKRVSFGIDGGK